GLGPGLRPAQFRVQLDRLDDLVADRIDRVQRGHRLLEDHRDVAPPQLAQLLGGHFQDLLPVEQNLPGQARALDQAQRRERSHRLAGSRLADQRQLLPGVEREAHPVDHPTGAEVDAEIAHFEQAHSASPSSILRRSSVRFLRNSARTYAAMPSQPKMAISRTRSQKLGENSEAKMISM